MENERQEIGNVNVLRGENVNGVHWNEVRLYIALLEYNCSVFLAFLLDQIFTKMPFFANTKISIIQFQNSWCIVQRLECPLQPDCPLWEILTLINDIID